MITRGVIALGTPALQRTLEKVAAYDAFDPGNDPYGEHDFGAIEVVGRRLFFKIDTYDLTLTAQSENPADPAVTTRVLTVMLAEEY